jgi:hypothetical protein
LQLDFSAQENMRDERLPVLLKRELLQRFHRLDLPKKRPAGGDDVLYG